MLKVKPFQETIWFNFAGQYIKPEELIVRQLIAIY